MEGELRYLMGRLSDIETQVGPPPSRRDTGRKKNRSGDSFMEIKSEVVNGVKRIHGMHKELQELKETGAEEKETIKVSTRMYKELRQCRVDVDEMAKIQEKERGKRNSKFDESELATRDELLDSLRMQVMEASHVVRARGGKVELDEEEARMDVPTLDEFVSKGGDEEGAGGDEEEDFATGATAGAGAGAGEDGEVVHEALTQRQEQVLALWNRSKEEEDTQLADIENVLTDIGELAEGVNEEAIKQNMMLDGLNEKVEGVRDKLGRAQEDLTEQIKQVRGSDKVCMDMICCIMLLGVATVIYNLLKSRL